MFCTGRIRHKGMPGGRSEAQPQASIERVRTWRSEPLCRIRFVLCVD
jgi:hypothetical protein